MRIAVVQMTSTDDVGANLAVTRAGIDEAAERGAEIVALPENFAFLRREGEPFPCAQGLDGEIVDCVRERARTHSVWILAGTFPEEAGDGRVFNTSVVLSPDGEIAAVYRKIHLFDVDLRSQGGGAFRESETIAPGRDVAVAETPFGAVGLSVCYDLRFPELYRELVVRGARILAVPSAFTRATGKDHWEVLLRARAIENQSFVVAAAQCGRHSETRASHGRSLVVDPWGVILAQATDRPAVITADCDLSEIDRIRAAIPALAHRRL